VIGGEPRSSGIEHLIRGQKLYPQTRSRLRGIERPWCGGIRGRENHFRSRSRRGTEVAALFYSLCETARLAGVEPEHYLLEATRRALAEPGTVTLPHDLQS
jgi:hypothetical protein